MAEVNHTTDPVQRAELLQAHMKSMGDTMDMMEMMMDQMMQHSAAAEYDPDTGGYC